MNLTRESPFYQNVQTLAHYLYVMRGCKEGESLENWLEAEAQLRKCDDIDVPRDLTSHLERE